MISRTETNAAEWDRLEQHVDNIIDLARGVRPGEKIILVGPNCSGKSLFRKLINGRKRKRWTIVHASMQLRTESRPDMGALSSMAHDFAEDATSQSTINVIKRSIASVKENCVLHIDEPEIGFSEELQAGTAPWLRKQLDAMPIKPVVTIITTHSIPVASGFLDWKLIDLGFRYKTVSEWIHRPIEPMDPEQVETGGQLLFSVIQQRINSQKKS